MVIFQRESAKDLWREALPIFEQHALEQQHDQDIPLDLNIPIYCKLEDADVLRCYTVRDDRALIGYAVFSCLPSIRHKTSLQANLDSLYIVPEQRKGRTGLKLLSYVERELKKEGVQVLHMHAHPSTPFAALLSHRGYDLVHYEYEKRLDK